MVTQKNANTKLDKSYLVTCKKCKEQGVGDTWLIISYVMNKK